MRPARGAALAALASFFGLAGCATVPPAPTGWVVREVTAGGHLLATAAPLAPRPGTVLTVVIEGDGPAHDAAGRASADPTPRKPVGLAIAAVSAQAWAEGPVAWMARPCQFVRARDPACHPEVWTRDRFGAAALSSLDAGVDTLKAEARADRVRLVGWSGGGTLAAALATTRQDVEGLVTFAAPLDIDAWTAASGLTPLGQADSVRRLGSKPLPIPQIHLLGVRDRIVPAGPGADAARRLGGRVETVDAAHHCCWADWVGKAAADLAHQTGP